MFIHGNFISSSLACLNLKFQTIVSYIYCNRFTTYCIFIKSPEGGRLGCPKYRENQLVRRFFFAVFLILVYFSYFKNSRILIVVIPIEVPTQHLEFIKSVGYRTRCVERLIKNLLCIFPT